MIRSFRHILLLICCLLTVTSAFGQVLELDKPVNTDLLFTSEYYSDTTAEADFDTVKQLSNDQWQQFNREQFRWGFIDNPMWVRSKLSVQGSKARKIALSVHNVMDHLELEVSAPGEPVQHFIFGRSTPPRQAEGETHQFHNHVEALFKPGLEYDVIVRIESDNPVIGAYRAIEIDTLAEIAQREMQWMLPFLILFFLVSFYNVVIYMTTRQSAFIFHIGYVLSILAYLMNDYGYIELWTGRYDLDLMQMMTSFSLIFGFISMLAFFKAMGHYHEASIWIKRIYRGAFLSGFITMIAVPLLPYGELIRFFTIQTLLSISVFIFLGIYASRKGEHRSFADDARSVTLRILMLIFAPSIGLHILNRMGVVDVTWYSDYILFISIFLEMILISGLLFLTIRMSNEAFQRERLINITTGLPNELALEAYYAKADDVKQQTLVKIWISGLDRLEVAFGPAVYSQFINDVAINLRQELADNPDLIRISRRKRHFPLFHNDKNTFTVVCQYLDNKSFDRLRHQLNSALATTHYLHKSSLDCNIVVGAYEYDRKQTSYEMAMQNSTMALSYSIKNNLPFKLYDQQIGFNQQQHATLMNQFQQSLKDDEFFLLWQPQYNTQTKEIQGVEVLVRWMHKEYGLIGPDLFIPMLEESNRICELSQWVIGQVFDFMPMVQNIYPGLDVSINLSARDLLEDGLIRFLDRKIQKHADLVQFITLEITETLLIRDYDQVQKSIEALQSRGFQISIDDFGSGYTSFAYLQNFSANELKIDKIYTDGYLEKTSNAVLKSIIYMAQLLNMRIVVEGVEEQQQVELFRELGVERLQGWLLDKPMTLSTLLSKPVTVD